MEFFDKIGKKASEAYKITADKTGKIAKEAKLKLKMGDLKSQVSEIYEEIGKKVYERHVRGEQIDIEKDLEEQCTKIDVLSAEIDSLLKECMDLKDKKQCQKCFKEIDKNMNFCPECGAKQETDPAREVEILNRLEKVDIVSEPVDEENQDDSESKDNLEKTVIIETSPDTEDVGPETRIEEEKE